MKEYQLGNKVTCIVRAYTPGQIGQTILQYQNEPYTILKDLNAVFSFRDESAAAMAGSSRHAYYNSSELSQVRLMDVHLTDRVFAMLFQSRDDGLCSHIENVNSDKNGKVYLTTDQDNIYQVFIYKEDSSLEKAYGQIAPSDIEVTPNGTFLVIYQTLKNKVLTLDTPQNRYFSLDFICEGNTDEITSSTYIHVEKVGIKVDRDLYFNANLNAVDITFNVISTAENYIILN